MTRARVGTSIALGALIAMTASLSCGAFGADSSGADGGAFGADADSAAACSSASCADAGDTCVVRDFQSCGSEVDFQGDITNATVMKECKDGKLHLAAKYTLDIFAELTFTTPDKYEAVHVAALLAVVDWNAGRVLRVSVGGTVVGEIQTTTDAMGRTFSFCSNGDCGTELFRTKAGEAHQLELDITRTSVALRVDCKPFATRATMVDLGMKTTVSVSFGRLDANPIDGTLDDLRVSYE
jgi:hypothetical protein